MTRDLMNVGGREYALYDRSHHVFWSEGMYQISIQLRVDFTGTKAEVKEKQQAVVDQACDLAKQLTAFATLLSDKRKPQCKMEHGDGYSADEGLEIFTAEDLS